MNDLEKLRQRVVDLEKRLTKDESLLKQARSIPNIIALNALEENQGSHLD
jgi:hypothetical protein